MSPYPLASDHQDKMIFKARGVFTRSGMTVSAWKDHIIPHHPLSSIKWQQVQSGPVMDPSTAIHEAQNSCCIKLDSSLSSSSYSWSWCSAQPRLGLLSAASLGLLNLVPSFSFWLPHSFPQPWSPLIPPSFHGSPLSLFWSKVSLLSPGCFLSSTVVVGFFENMKRCVIFMLNNPRGISWLSGYSIMLSWKHLAFFLASLSLCHFSLCLPATYSLTPRGSLWVPLE